MELFLKIPPLQEPLTIKEVSDYLRLPPNVEESYLQSLISSARAYVEGAIGRALLKQMWTMQLKPPYPRTSPLVKCEEKRLEVELPHPPLLEIESIKTGEKDIRYRVEESKVLLPPSFWNKEISISYWAGYGETPAALPPDLKMAVLMAAQCFYDNQIVELPLLKPFKVIHLI